MANAGEIVPYAGQKRGPKDRYTLDRGWVSTNHFGLAHRCGESEVAQATAVDELRHLCGP